MKAQTTVSDHKAVEMFFSAAMRQAKFARAAPEDQCDVAMEASIRLIRRWVDQDNRVVEWVEEGNFPRNTIWRATEVPPSANRALTSVVVLNIVRDQARKSQRQPATVPLNEADTPTMPNYEDLIVVLKPDGFEEVVKACRGLTPIERTALTDYKLGNRSEFRDLGSLRPYLEGDGQRFDDEGFAGLETANQKNLHMGAREKMMLALGRRGERR